MTIEEEGLGILLTCLSQRLCNTQEQMFSEQCLDKPGVLEGQTEEPSGHSKISSKIMRLEEILKGVNYREKKPKK